MKDSEKELWEKCVHFHGHSCGGLAVGFQAALFARELLDIHRAQDEELVCVTENDACGVDAIQVILGCTAGKGNLIFNIQGKSAYSFYLRESGKAFRLILKPAPEMDREARMAWLLDQDYHDLFSVKPAPDPMPAPARIFENCTCSLCGERMSENHAHLQRGRIVCDRCYEPYSRGF